MRLFLSIRATLTHLLMAIVVTGLASGTPMHAAAFAASPADEAASMEAKKHYEEGTKAFNLAEFPRAISEFKAAYNAKPDPLLLYNIGQSFRLAGDDAQALFFYKSFLRNMPDAPNRKEVDGRIRALEKQIAEQPKKAPAASAPTATMPPPATTTPAAPVSATPVSPAAEMKPSVAPVNAPADHRATNNSTTTSAAILVAPPPPPTSPPPVVDTTAASTAPPSTDTDAASSSPIYKKWWFWVGVGTVALVGIAAAGNANKAPSTKLGVYEPVFK